MEIPKHVSQILIEELIEDFPALHSYRFIDARPDIDSSWITIRLRDSHGVEVTLRILPNGSLAGHKSAIKKALIANDPSLLEVLYVSQSIERPR